MAAGRSLRYVLKLLSLSGFAGLITLQHNANDVDKAQDVTGKDEIIDTVKDQLEQLPCLILRALVECHSWIPHLDLEALAMRGLRHCPQRQGSEGWKP